MLTNKNIKTVLSINIREWFIETNMLLNEKT